MPSTLFAYHQFFASIMLLSVMSLRPAIATQPDDDILLDVVPAIVASIKANDSSSFGIADLDFGTVIRSSDLGWEPGQDISGQLSALFSDNVIRAGTTLLLEAMFEIQGSIRINAPSNFILAGSTFGTGLTIRNTEALMRDPWLRMGSNSALVNLSIIHKETLPYPTEPGITSEGKSNTRSITANGDNIKLINNYFEGNTGIFVDASGRDHLVQSNHFNGTTTQLRVANYIDAQILNSLFENALGDGIKSLRPGSGQLGVENPLVKGSVFMNNRRDGIDTTGGFRNALVSDSFFIKLFKGLDLKNIYDQNTRVFADQTLQSLNRTIRIERCEFVDSNNGVAAITLDRGPSGDGSNKWITNSNASNWLTQDIVVANSVFEGGNNALLLQDVHTVSWSNLQLYGGVNTSKVSRNPAVSSQVAPSVNVNFNISGQTASREPARVTKPDSFYRNLAGTDPTLRLRLN